MADIRPFGMVDGGKKEDEEESLGLTRKDVEDLIEFFVIKAELNRNYYEHLIKQGFSAKEALEIVKSDTTFNARR